MGERFVYDRFRGCVVPLSEYERPEPQRSFLAAPMLVRDSMDAIKHPVDGKLYDSKSTFSRITKDAGMIEVGNDPARLRPPPKPRPDRNAIKETVQKAMARVANGERI